METIQILNKRKQEIDSEILHIINFGKPKRKETRYDAIIFKVFETMDQIDEFSKYTSYHYQDKVNKLKARLFALQREAKKIDEIEK